MDSVVYAMVWCCTKLAYGSKRACVCVYKNWQKCIAMSTECTGSLQTRLQRVANGGGGNSNSNINGCWIGSLALNLMVCHLHVIVYVSISISLFWFAMVRSCTDTHNSKRRVHTAGKRGSSVAVSICITVSVIWFSTNLQTEWCHFDRGSN